MAPVPLLDPQRQRELIRQAAGPSTRQFAGLIAAAAPEVVPPRDTLRAVGSGRYTLKVNIDEECERGLRLLKGLLSHLDPRMSWNDLVARLVHEAVERHDPRGGGRGRRRRVSRAAGRTAERPSGGSATPAPQSNLVDAERRRDSAAVRRFVWQRDQGRCCYRDPLTGRRCTSSHLLQIDHLLPVAQGDGADPDNLRLACFAHHRMRHRDGPAAQPEPPI